HWLLRGRRARELDGPGLVPALAARAVLDRPRGYRPGPLLGAPVLREDRPPMDRDTPPIPLPGRGAVIGLPRRVARWPDVAIVLATIALAFTMVRWADREYLRVQPPLTFLRPHTV